ncbi:MAG: 1,4-alpha-glucan branching protein GlgB [Oscillospiraceae bacterium]|nr:1,4-alpha-glucan branching protein GlgB [Oscillospiraceae bacterium]
MTKKRAFPFDLTTFFHGHSTTAWRYLGAHPADGGFLFRVWAPNAHRVSVFGPFNGWDPNAAPLTRADNGIWEGFVPNLTCGEQYQYAVWDSPDHYVGKADPYALQSKHTASVTCDLSGYTWGDKKWFTYRRTHPCYNGPLNIYEVHLGSWRRTGEGNWLSYRDVADLLVPYVKEMGYTHVEFMPITEHPLDMSWGYQCTGYFSPTARFGSPHDLMYLVDRLHQAGVGVILDWVPAHFPRDAFGLYHFDGTPTYEYADPRKGEQPEWGTNCFDWGRNEVRSFLFSSALFWLEQYHFDGLRVDAVSSMLYLDYGRGPENRTTNGYGGHENLEAISFFQDLNTLVFSAHPDVLMIAEESTAWPKVTAPVSDGGLGFNFKWNMGWMNDACHYLKMDPIYRQYHHSDLTFSLMYAFSENYILPISHDEVVHMKGSLIGKMPGDDPMKFAGVRTFYTYMLTHPGKKLMIMGSELGQFNEWHYEYSLDWHLLDYEPHQKIHEFFKSANQLYLEQPALWQRDRDWGGFEWLDADDTNGNTVSFLRRDKAGKSLVIVCNFSPVPRPGYRVGLPCAGTYQSVFDTNWSRFGGSDPGEGFSLPSQPIPWQNQAQSLQFDLPAMSCVIFRCTRKAPAKKKA